MQISKHHVITGRPPVLLWAVLSLAVSWSGPANAQIEVSDTMQVVSTAINPGDTGAVHIFTANKEAVGAFTLRIVYDTSLLEVVTMQPDSPQVEATQLRSTMGIFAFAQLEPGIITGLGSSFSPLSGLAAGRGKTIRFRFHVRESAERGRVTRIPFVDDPQYPQSFNWFSGLGGQYQYRPVLVAGFITIGEAEELQVACPISTTLGCDGEADPAQTGRALASDPGATVTYADESFNGACPGESVIHRTWTATLGSQDTSCVQVISLRDTVAPSVSCPRTTNVEFGMPPDPGRTGYATAFDNCDPLPNIAYTDTELPGIYPVHRVITRTWLATDGCGNRESCLQRIRELAQGVPDTTTIPEDGQGALTLHPLWPNPFLPGRDSVDSVRFTVARAGHVKVAIYDLTGRRMKTLYNERVEAAGTYRTTWTGRDAANNPVPAGVYLCRLELDGKSVTQKVAVIR